MRHVCTTLTDRSRPKKPIRKFWTIDSRRLDAGTLVELTHAPGGPWHKVWHHSGKINPGMRIDNRDIERFYARIPRFPTLQ
jgi:uncharacterized phage-associated protein